MSDKPAPTQQSVIIPAIFGKDKLPKGHIGYYNPHNYPVMFTSNFSQRGETSVESKAAVTGVDGQLVDYDPDLERQVADKVLARILPGDVNYTRFARENVIAAGEAANPRPAQPNRVIGSPEQLADAKDIKYSVENVDGVDYYIYDDTRFTSIASLNAYIRQKEGNH